VTAGGGICHSEVSIESNDVLHGVQLWVALPNSDRDTGRDFAHYVPTQVFLPGAVARVSPGERPGTRSPVHTFAQLLGAKSDLDVDAGLDIDGDLAFEHGVLCDAGPV